MVTAPALVNSYHIAEWLRSPLQSKCRDAASIARVGWDGHRQAIQHFGCLENTGQLWEAQCNMTPCPFQTCPRLGNCITEAPLVETSRKWAGQVPRDSRCFHTYVHQRNPVPKLVLLHPPCDNAYVTACLFSGLLLLATGGWSVEGDGRHSTRLPTRERHLTIAWIAWYWPSATEQIILLKVERYQTIAVKPRLKRFKRNIGKNVSSKIAVSMGKHI